MKTKAIIQSLIGMTVVSLVCFTSALTAQLAPAENEEVLPVIDLQDTTIDAAIKGLAEMANLNVHLDPKISATPMGPDGKPTPLPKVSIKWKNLTARQALSALLDNYGYVATTDPKTKVTRITTKDPNAQEPLVAHVIHIKFGTVTNLVTLLKPSLSTRSQIYADARTSQLLILTTDTEYNNLTNFLAKLDIATPQILIEARFMETTKNPKSVKGINWEKTLGGQNVAFGNGITSASTTTTTPGTAVTTTGATPPGGGPATSSTYTPGYSANSTISSLFGNGASGAGMLPGGLSLDTARGFYPGTAFLSADGVRAVLSFLNSDSDTESIATPRAVTQEGVATELSVVRNIPVFEEQQGAATGGIQQANTAKPNYDLKVGSVTLNEVGIKLIVTPRVVGIDDIFMELKPEISALETELFRTTLNGKINEAPVFTRRKLTTQATVPSGNTLVLGGLLSDETAKTFTKVPLMGDIPGLGLLFRQDGKSRKKSNLIIFVTPSIVESEDFQTYKSEFLKTKLEDKKETVEPAWDTGKPASKDRPLF